LLDYVSNGGTLVVQYNSGVGDFNNGKFTPYPALASRARVSVEESPVQILAPDDGIFHYPNEIAPRTLTAGCRSVPLLHGKLGCQIQALLACNDPDRHVGEEKRADAAERAEPEDGTQRGSDSP